jgi:hypothetical protein
MKGAKLHLLVAPAVMGGTRWETVPAPDAAFSWLPFTVQQKGRKFRATGWTIDQNRPTGKAYYVATTGNDANNGLSAAAPLRKIMTALGKADVDVVYVAAGVYGYHNGFENTVWTRSVSVIATGGRVVVGAFCDLANLSWALDVGGGRPNTYKAARTNVGSVRDAAFPDAKGDHSILTTQASADAVEANPGSWYTDGTSIWVRTSDSRAPDYDIHPYFSNITAGVNLPLVELYTARE